MPPKRNPLELRPPTFSNATPSPDHQGSVSRSLCFFELGGPTTGPDDFRTAISAISVPTCPMRLSSAMNFKSSILISILRDAEKPSKHSFVNESASSFCKRGTHRSASPTLSVASCTAISIRITTKGYLDVIIRSSKNVFP